MFQTPNGLMPYPQPLAFPIYPSVVFVPVMLVPYPAIPANSLMPQMQPYLGGAPDPGNLGNPKSTLGYGTVDGGSPDPGNVGNPKSSLGYGNINQETDKPQTDDGGSPDPGNLGKPKSSLGYQSASKE